MDDIIYSNNPNVDSVQAQIEGKYHKTSLVRSIGNTAVMYQDNPNVGKVLFTGEDGKIHTATLVKDINGGDQHNLGYYATLSALQEAHPTAEAGDYAIVGATDTIWIWDTDTSAWVDSDQKGQVTSVNGQTGAVTVQETLVSGTNIKTVNNTSLLGSGNITIDSLPTQTGNSGKFLTTNGTTASWDSITTTPSTMPTLLAANWSSNTQTVNVTGVTATNTVLVSPSPVDAEDYAAAGVLCTAQGAGTLTFTCDTVPSGDLDVIVVILA